MIPRDVLAPTVAIPFHKLLKIVAIVDARDARRRNSSPRLRPKISKSKCARPMTGMHPKTPP